MAPEDDGAGWPVVAGYALHEVLGRGSSATVYRATQTSVDRPVALKVLGGAALDPTTERRFRREVLAVGALADHPHVVAPIDAGTTTAGAPFVALPLVRAGSFGDRIRAFGPLTPTEVARVGAEVADALEAAHAAGILHRAVTPDNVLVGHRGRALLTDFGTAALDDGGERPSAAGDVHDLGATLHALAAGESPGPLPPEVPAALADLIGACRAEDPAERPSLAAVATALEAIAADRSEPPVPVPAAAPARPARTGVPSGLPVRRMVVVAVLVALSMVAAVVLLVVLGGDDEGASGEARRSSRSAPPSEPSRARLGRP